MTYTSCGFNNWVGKDFGTGNAYSVARFQAFAPNDAPFINGQNAYRLEAAANGAVWTEIYRGTTSGAVGEVIDVTLSSITPYYRYFRLNFNGDTGAAIGVAQFVLYAAGYSSVSTTPSSSSPPTALPSLDFSVDTNSMYIPLMIP